MRYFKYIFCAFLTLPLIGCEEVKKYKEKVEAIINPQGALIKQYNDCYQIAMNAQREGILAQKRIDAIDTSPHLSDVDKFRMTFSDTPLAKNVDYSVPMFNCMYSYGYLIKDPSFKKLTNADLMRMTEREIEAVRISDRQYAAQTPSAWVKAF